MHSEQGCGGWLDDVVLCPQTGWLTGEFHSWVCCWEQGWLKADYRGRAWRSASSALLLPFIIYFRVTMMQAVSPTRSFHLTLSVLRPTTNTSQNKLLIWVVGVVYCVSVMNEVIKTVPQVARGISRFDLRSAWSQAISFNECPSKCCGTRFRGLFVKSSSCLSRCTIFSRFFCNKLGMYDWTIDNKTNSKSHMIHV